MNIGYGRGTSWSLQPKLDFKFIFKCSALAWLYEEGKATASYVQRGPLLTKNG